MLQFLLDTDHLTLFEHGHPPLKQHLATHAPGAVGLTVVTLANQLILVTRNRQDFGRIPGLVLEDWSV